MTQKTGKYNCPRIINALGKTCGNKKENIILFICKVCDDKHQHMKCSVCEYEWNEWL